MKVSWKPGTMVYPLPAVLVSCGNTDDTRNLITVAWTGTICTNPPMLYISVRPERYSYDIIRSQGEFTVCLTTQAMARDTDWCGVKSGRDVDKWAMTGLTPLPGQSVGTLMVAESPLCIECRVKQVLPLGSHDMFIADVVNVVADDAYIDPETGRFDLARSGLMAYSHGHYHALGDEIGHFGFSVRRDTSNSDTSKSDTSKSDTSRGEISKGEISKGKISKSKTSNRNKSNKKKIWKKTKQSVTSSNANTSVRKKV